MILWCTSYEDAFCLKNENFSLRTLTLGFLWICAQSCEASEHLCICLHPFALQYLRSFIRHYFVLILATHLRCLKVSKNENAVTTAHLALTYSHLSS